MYYDNQDQSDEVGWGRQKSILEKLERKKGKMYISFWMHRIGIFLIFPFLRLQAQVTKNTSSTVRVGNFTGNMLRCAQGMVRISSLKPCC